MGELVYHSVFIFCTKDAVLLCNVNSYVFHHLFSPPFSLCLCCWWSSWKPQSSIRARSSLRQQRHWEGEASFTHAQDFRLSEMLRGQQATTHTNPSSWCGGFYMSIRTLLDVVLQARAMPLPLLTSPCISTQNEELSVISLYALAGSD